MEKLCFEGKAVALIASGTPGAPLIVVNGEDGEGEGEALCAAVQAATGAAFSLAAVGGLDWDDDLTPWEAPGVFKGQHFGGHAGAWLGTLTGEALPAILGKLPERPAWVGLAGYSLAGLFAAWATYQTDAFDRIACVSGSVWFPGFIDYAAANAPARVPERAYLSVGDKEARARNPAMRTVEDATRRMAALYEAVGAATRFELNPGGHFNDPLGRLTKGIAWLMEE